MKGNYGLFCAGYISAGELLIVWGGEIIPYEGLAALSEVQRQHSVQVEEALYLVTVKPPDAGDFINHSCDPSAGLSGQIAVVAMRDIYPGEEVCYDYAMSDGSPYDEFDCGCGSANCRRRVTGDDWRRPELQARYAGYFSPYLQRRIERMQHQWAQLDRNGRAASVSSSRVPIVDNASYAGEMPPAHPF